MYTKPEIVMFHVNTEGQGSGEKTFTNADGIVDLAEFKRCCKDHSKFVVICLCPTNGTTMAEEFFTQTAKMIPESDCDDIFVFSCYARNGTQTLNRKMIFRFNKDDENPSVKVNYYNS